MNPEIKTKWLEALRSGKYKQGNRVLRKTTDDQDEYCCLGVLCDLISPEKWHKPEIGTWVAFLSTNGDKKRHFPPDEIMRVAGLSTENGDTLAGKNDEGESFEEIAKYIEENP
jgi:hypothetical protein